MVHPCGEALATSTATGRPWRAQMAMTLLPLPRRVGPMAGPLTTRTERRSSTAQWASVRSMPSSTTAILTSFTNSGETRGPRRRAAAAFLCGQRQSALRIGIASGAKARRKNKDANPRPA
jgi:hypothetical protein